MGSCVGTIVASSNNIRSWSISWIMTQKMNQAMTYCQLMNIYQVAMKIISVERELLQTPNKWSQLTRSLSMQWKNLICHTIKKLKKLLQKLIENQMSLWPEGKQYCQSWFILDFKRGFQVWLLLFSMMTFLLKTIKHSNVLDCILELA